ncbi:MULTISPECIES: hypothetical protein [unclassified Modestobacter]
MSATIATVAPVTTPSRRHHRRHAMGACRVGRPARDRRVDDGRPELRGRPVPAVRRWVVLRGAPVRGELDRDVVRPAAARAPAAGR